MRKNISLILSLLAFIAVLTLLLDYQIKPDIKTLDEISKSANTPAHEAPDFSFTDVKDRTSNLKDLKGKIVILHFWATWCPPCIQEFPKLVAAAEEFKENTVVLAVSSDSQKSVIEKFLKTSAPQIDKASNIFVIWDKDRNITHDLYQTFTYPETIIIDGQGRMLRKISGDADWTSPEMKSYLKGLTTPLAGGPIKP